jgi:hypothetical protein
MVLEEHTRPEKRLTKHTPQRQKLSLSCPEFSLELSLITLRIRPCSLAVFFVVFSLQTGIVLDISFCGQRVTTTPILLASASTMPTFKSTRVFIRGESGSYVRANGRAAPST